MKQKFLVTNSDSSVFEVTGQFVTISEYPYAKLFAYKSDGLWIVSEILTGFWVAKSSCLSMAIQFAKEKLQSLNLTKETYLTHVCQVYHKTTKERQKNRTTPRTSGQGVFSLSDTLARKISKS